jgi:hypothetical protein
LVDGINNFGKWSLYMADNTPAVRAVQRRYSSSAAMYSQLKRLTQDRSVCVRYIPGTLNPADAPSRLSPCIVTYEVVRRLLNRDGWCVGGTGASSSPSRCLGIAHLTNGLLSR